MSIGRFDLQAINGPWSEPWDSISRGSGMDQCGQDGMPYSPQVQRVEGQRAASDGAQDVGNGDKCGACKATVSSEGGAVIYTTTLAAIVSALAADAIDNTSKQAWQKLYRAGFEEGLDLASLRGHAGGDLTRLDVDCWLHARLHKSLKPMQWHALVAKYSTHKARKVEAIGKLCPVIASHAPSLFIYKAVTAWAIPQLKGAEGKRSTDLIVLPASFYDVNTWDTAASPERTRRRWKSGINERLEDIVRDAINSAEQILLSEGLLFDSAA